MITKEIGFICNLCGTFIDLGDEKMIDGYFFHREECYPIVLDRLSNFWTILTLPENEWQEWMDDDSQKE